MKTITTNNRTLLFVEVPEDARNFGFRSGHFSYQLPDMEYEAKLVPEVRLKNKGRLTFIATTDTITEKQAAMFVEKKHDNPFYFKNYYVENGACMYVSVSFATLLQHHSITGRHAIIEIL